MTKTPTRTPTNTPTSTQTVFSFLGGATFFDTTAPNACNNFSISRTFYSNKSLLSLGVSDIMYDNFALTIPTNGNGLFIALSNNGGVTRVAFEIASNGLILDTYICP